MAYIKQTWQNNPPSTATPITAERLEHLETQYDEALAQVAADIADPDSDIGTELNSTIVAQVAQATAGLISDTQYTSAPWTPGSKPPVYPRMTTLTTFGSSSVSGLAASLPSLMDQVSVTVVNRGQSGERWEHTLARNGIVPARITFTANTVQASGAAAVTTSLPTTFSLLTYRGTLSGTNIKGTLSLSGGVFTFTREGTGSAVVLDGPVEFIPTPTNAGGIPVNPSYRDTVTILDVGKNNADDGAGAHEGINAAMDALTAWLVPMVKRYLILGLFANTGSNSAHKANIAAVNAHRVAIGGDRFLDLQGYVTGEDVWDHTGISPDSTDLAQQAAGEKPHSLSSDSAHLNSAAWSAFRDHVVKPKLAELGWYTFPDTTAGLRNTWKAADLSLTDGADVTSWASSVEGGTTLDNKVGSAWAWPKYRATAGPGGAPAVEFDRDTFSFIQSAAISPAETAPWTWLALVKTSSGGTLFGGTTGTVRIIGNDTDWTTFRSDGGAPLVNPDGPDGDWQVVVLVVNGASSVYRVGNNTVTGSLTNAPTIGRYTMGGINGSTTGSESSFLDGHVVEVRDWSRALSAGEIAAAVAEIRAEYGLS